MCTSGTSLEGRRSPFTQALLRHEKRAPHGKAQPPTTRRKAPDGGQPYQLDVAVEAIQAQSIRYGVFQSVYNYWREKHETELLDDSLALPGFPTFPCKIGSSEGEFVDSDDVANSRPHIRPTLGQNPSLVDSKLMMVSGGSLRRELRRQHVPQGWLHKMDPLEPVLLFTRPLDPEKLAAAGIVPPSDDSSMKHSPSSTHN